MSIISNINTSNTKLNIMKSAIQLIRDSDNGQITIAEICAATGITKSTFYYHFHSIDEIIEFFLEYLGESVKDSMPQILLQETTFKQILSIFLLLDESLVEAGPSICNHRYCYLFKQNQELNFPEQEPTWEIVVTLIKKAQTSGEILNTGAPEEVAATCFFISRGICTTWAMEGGSFDFKKKVKEKLSILLQPAKGFELGLDE